MGTAPDPARLPEPRPFEVAGRGVTLRGEESGAGPALVLLHGLTATRRYVLMGSRLLERRGYRVIAYDARGHGESGAPPDRSAYEYGDLVADVKAVLDRLEIERAVLVGSSMGAATAMAVALDAPGRVAALVQSTPAYAGESAGPADLSHWDALADALEREGPDGFMRVFAPTIAGRFRDSVLRLTRQRIERHRDLRAVSDAIRVVPRSRAFDGLDALAGVTAPTLLVGSRDEADPTHPLAVARAYDATLPDSELVVEEPGRPPLAWRGAHVSRAIDDFLRRRAPEFAPRRGSPAP